MAPEGSALSRGDVAGPRFADAAELAAWLGEHNVDTSVYGRGSAKTVEDLLGEIEAGETRLEVVASAAAAGGRAGARRIVEVLNVYISSDDGKQARTRVLQTAVTLLLSSYCMQEDYKTCSL